MAMMLPYLPPEIYCLTLLEKEPIMVVSPDIDDWTNDEEEIDF